MKALALLALPLFAQPGAESLSREMVRQARTAPWGRVYEAKPGCQKFVAGGNTPFAAIAQWSYACSTTFNGVGRTEYYYATPFGTVTLQYVHLFVAGLTTNQDDVFEAVRLRLTRGLGESIRPFGLLHTGAWQYPPQRAGQRWSTPAAEIILHQHPHQPLYGEMLAGPQLAIIEHSRFAMAEEDQALDREIGLENNLGARRLGLERLRRDFPKYARLLILPDAWPKDVTPLREPTVQAVVELLQQSAAAAPNERAAMLILADELAERLSNLLFPMPGDPNRTDSLLAQTRRILKSQGATLGEPTHYEGLAYDHGLLRRAVKEGAGTEWGEVAFLRNLVLGCPDVDFFATVIRNGEAYLGAHPGMKYRKELLFSLAISYESWWSTTNAPSSDVLAHEQFAPVRRKYVTGARSARARAIELYDEVVRLASDSVEAKAAARQLPRLKLRLDTGQRAFVCTYC